MLRYRFSAAAKKEKQEDAARWKRLGPLDDKRRDWAMYGLKGGLSTLTDRLAADLRTKGVSMRLGEHVKELDCSLKDQSLSVSRL